MIKVGSAFKAISGFILEKLTKNKKHLHGQRSSRPICPSTYIFFISKLGRSIQSMTSGNKETMSLLLMVILATIFLRAIFLAE